jgi:hypothetical protein
VLFYEPVREWITGMGVVTVTPRQAVQDLKALTI